MIQIPWIGHRHFDSHAWKQKLTSPTEHEFIYIYILIHIYIAHWGQGKMVGDVGTVFINTFFSTKTIQFQIKFHWNIFLRINLTISWWCHQMETFSTLLSFYVGNSSATSEFPHKGQWHGALMFSLICSWINGWVNNWDASDLIGHHAYYDVTVMFQHWSDNGMAPNRWQAIIWTNDGLAYLHIYASLGLDELTRHS